MEKPNCCFKATKFYLLASVKDVTQRVLSYPGNFGTGLWALAKQVEQIFNDELSKPSGKSNEEGKFPGLLLCLQWCISRLKSNSASKSLAENIEKELQICDCPEEYLELLQNLFMIGNIVECIIIFIQNKWYEGFCNYSHDAFLNDDMCVFTLIGCLKALCQRSSMHAAGVPLSSLEYGYGVLNHHWKVFNRVHSVSDKLATKGMAQTRRIAGTGQDFSQQLNECATRPSILPDVVACTKISLNQGAEKKGYEADMTGRKGSFVDLEQCNTLMNDTDGSSDVERLDCARSRLSDIPKTSEAVFTDTSLHDKSASPSDYVGENAQLHLSELLITVIQGRKCGLSKPDLLDSSIDNQVPDAMKKCGFSESDSLHDIAFSIEDSLWKDDVSLPDIQIGSIYDSGSRTEEIEALLTDMEDVEFVGSRLDCCVSEDDVPQSLLPLPKSLSVGLPEDTDSLTGSCSGLFVDTFSPSQVRLQFMSRSHKGRGRSFAMAQQKYKCSGCGMHAERSAAKQFKYCEYFGKYFCAVCHDGKASRMIPARIFCDFNFKHYKVSEPAKLLLEEIHYEPIFNTVEISGALLSKNKSFSNFVDLRKLASRSLKQLEMCAVVWETTDNCIQVLDKLPPYFLRSDPHLFSIQDMIEFKSGKLEKQLRSFVQLCSRHMKNCDFCSFNMENLGLI